MRKVLLLMALAMLGVLMFASLAYAEHNAAHVRAGSDGSPCPNPDFPRLTPDGCQTSNLLDVERGSDASASPSAGIESIAESCNDQPDPAGCKRQLRGAEGFGSTASPTASATVSATASAAADSQYEAELPETGGAASLALVSAVALLAGGGLLAFGIVRHR